MRPFEYLEPETLGEACELLSSHCDEAKIIAGGQSLLPILKHRLTTPKYIINIKPLAELEYIREDGGWVKIGALTTHRAVESSQLIKEKLPILAEMEKVVASVQVRNWGTIGGDLCHADPGGDPGPALIALGAWVTIKSVRGERQIPLEGFFVSYLETALGPDEILTSIEVPVLAPQTGTSYIKESVRWGDHPIASVASLVVYNEEKIKDARIVLGGVGNTPVRAREAEKALIGMKVGDNLEMAGEAAAREARPKTDVEGSSEYKQAIIKVVIKQSVSLAKRRAQTPGRR